MKKGLVVILCFLLIVQLSGCLDETTTNKKRESISIAISQDITGFYPWEKSYEIYTVLVNRNIYNSLVEFDEIFKINPCLAKSWNNPDNLTWRFNLRENVTFHNGNKFTSQDVKYTIELIMDNESSDNQLKELLKSIGKINIIDNYTIDLKTIRPCPVLLNMLTDIFIVSKQYQEETQNQLPIGTGPYKLINYSKGEYIDLQRYENYWKKPLPGIKHARFMIINNYESCAKAFIDQEVHIAQINKKQVENITSFDFTIKTIDNPTVAYISFDFREINNITGKNEKNPFADIRVRKAIYHSLNIDDFLNNYSKMFCNCSQFVIPLIFGYNPGIKRLDYNLNKAKQLMKDAGYENGFNVVFDYSYEVFSDKIIEFIRGQLFEIGINLTINPLSYGEFLTKLTAFNSSMYVNCWTTGTGDSGEIYDYLIGTRDEIIDIGTFNVGLYSNPEVDSLGKNASICMDIKKRQEILQDCFKIAMDDVAWIPLFTWKISYGINNQFDWTPRADQQILIEYIKLKN